MNHITPRQLNKEIRAITSKLGWDICATYTDPRMNGKRVKFRCNVSGPDIDTAVADKILVQVQNLIKKYGLQHSHKVKWDTNNCYTYHYYNYPYLAMHVTAS